MLARALVLVLVLAELSGCATAGRAPSGRGRDLVATDDPGAATTRSEDPMSAADRAFAAARYGEALALYEKAAAAAAQAALPARIMLEHRIGRTQTRLHRLGDARSTFDRALALGSQADPLVQAFIGPVLREAQGEVLRRLGEPRTARAEYERALAGYEARRKSVDAGRVRAEIGSTYVDEADFASALRQYALAREEMEAARSPDLGRLLVNTSSLLTWLGKYDDAQVLQGQAEAACSQQRDTACSASAAHVQGFTRFLLGDYEGAASASLRAAELFGAAPTVERARALNNLGMAWLMSHRVEAALAVLQQAFAILERAGASAKDQATVLDSLGNAYRLLGRHGEASLHYQDALVRWQLAGHREGERDTLANLGQLAFDMKEEQAAIFYRKLSVNLAQSLRANARGLEQGYLDALTRRLAPTYQTLADQLVAHGRIPEAHQVLRMLKEQELFEFLSRAGPAGDTTAPLNGVEQREGDAYGAIQARVFLLAQEFEVLNKKASESVTAAERARREELEAQLAQARADLEKFCRELNRGLAAIDSDAPRVAVNSLLGMQDTLRRLGGGAVLLHYVPLEDHLRIILTSATSQGVRGYTVPVGLQQLRETVAALRNQIQAVSPDAQATARTLHDWLLPPALRRDLVDAKAKVLMLSLGDVLRYLPFAALHDGQHWVAERYAVAMYTDAGKSRLERTPAPHWEVRAFGMTQAVDRYPALPFVRAELESIVGDQGLPGRAVFDGDFTEARLRDAVFQPPHPPVLHIASHFVFRPGKESDSFLLLGVGRLSLAAMKAWTFTGLDLLTLSACDTAVGGGINANGQEIEGFAALAQAQGADAVLATLWPVADVSTAAFMQSFYRSRRTRTGATKVEALQAIQTAMIRREITPASVRSAFAQRGTVEGSPTAGTPLPADYAHPFFWAPFVLMGNWR